MRSQDGSLFVQAIIAGIIGGIIVDAFLSIELHVSPIVLEAIVTLDVCDARPLENRYLLLYFRYPIAGAQLSVRRHAGHLQTRDVARRSDRLRNGTYT